MDELKPCPFCEDEAERISNNGLFGVHCKCVNCIAFDIEPQYRDRRLADKDWNRRPDHGTD